MGRTNTLGAVMPTCYLDMDGVLTDFTKAALALHGRSIPYDEIVWDFNEQLGIPAKQFWAPMGFEFWANLDWTAEGKDILRYVERYFGDRVVIMTSPIPNLGCAEGKLEWLRRELPSYARKFALCPVKHLTAGPGKVLIDDSDDNLYKFRVHGGKGILVPRPWNAGKTFDLKTLAGQISLASF
jgi:5'(3')-deoxyribonucleotidase